VVPSTARLPRIGVGSADRLLLAEVIAQVLRVSGLPLGLTGIPRYAADRALDVRSFLQCPTRRWCKGNY
jgi:hypothetical protein